MSGKTNVISSSVFLNPRGLNETLQRVVGNACLDSVQLRGQQAVNGCRNSLSSFPLDTACRWPLDWNTVLHGWWGKPELLYHTCKKERWCDFYDGRPQQRQMLLIVIMTALGVEGGGGEMVHELNSLEPQLHLSLLLSSLCTTFPLSSISLPLGLVTHFPTPCHSHRRIIFSSLVGNGFHGNKGCSLPLFPLIRLTTFFC